MCRVLILQLVLCGIFGCDVASAQSPSRASVLEICHAQSTRSGVLFAPVCFGEKELVALVDTGSSNCALDVNYYENIVPKPARIGQDLPFTVPDGASKNFSLCRVEVSLWPDQPTNVDAGLLDLKSSLKPERNMSCQFVTGVDLLSVCPFQISAGRTIQPVEIDSLIGKQDSIGIELSGPIRVPRLDVVACGLHTDAILDTGAMVSMTLKRGIIEKLLQRTSAIACPELDRPVVIADGRAITLNAYCLKEVVIGPQSFRNVLAYESASNAIGMPILRHFDMTVDLPGHRLWLDPLPSASKASFAPGGTGFNFQFDSEGRMKVQSPLRPDGPAERAGVRPDDEILEIDGKPVSDFTYYTATDRFSQAGTTLQLKCQREGKPFEVTMELKHRIAFPPAWPEEQQDVDLNQLFEELDSKRKK